MAFVEAGIALSREGSVLGGDLDRLLGVGLPERQPTLDAGAEAVVVEDLLDGDREDPDSRAPAP
jgi:hypothetical protein